MFAPAHLTVCSPVPPTQLATINDEQAFFNQAHDFFDFWHQQLHCSRQIYGDLLNDEWIITSLNYCEFGYDAINRKAPKEVIVFAKQLKGCLTLAQERGIFLKSAARIA